MSRKIEHCNVAVVGGAGFLGSHLVDHLIADRGCRVLVMDNLVSGHRKFVHPVAEFVHVDITGSESQIRKHFEAFQPQFVFNYAASPYIPVSFERPLYVMDVNAFGAMKVINAAQEVGVAGILQVSSAEIYGNQTGKISESAEVMPHSSYGASKAAIDYMVQVRWREAQTPVISLRQFNCVGPRETHPYVVPEIISQLAMSNVVKLGNNSFRDFQCCHDAVRMACELLERGSFGEVYNMGSEDGVKIYELAAIIGKLMGHSEVVVECDESRVRPWEIWHLQSDNTRLYSVIDRRPQYTLEMALEETIEYFHDNGGKWEF